jgi:hypothetical protein
VIPGEIEGDGAHARHRAALPPHVFDANGIGFSPTLKPRFPMGLRLALPPEQEKQEEEMAILNQISGQPVFHRKFPLQ